MSGTLAPGWSVSHYRVITPLGTGGMGEVYLAQDETLERRVALKVLPPELVTHEERVRRFVQEAKSASALSHPNIVTIYEIGQGDAQSGDAPASKTSAPIHFIAMELVAGDTIGHKIHHEKTALRTLLGYLAQAAEGVASAHAAGIVHRDLKPDNIMVTKDGYAKVLDCGLAKLTERQLVPGDLASAPTQAKTVEGLVLGTVGYMSPEQVQGKPADHRSDIFSFGCILYEATTRRRAFTADSDIETMHRILNATPEPIDQLNPEAPAELRRLIRRCLAKAPEQRLQSMKDLSIEIADIVQEFDNLSASSPSRLSGGVAVAGPRPGRRARRAGVAAVAIVGIAGLAFGLFGVLQRRGRSEPPTSGFQSMRMTRLTTSGNVTSAALSRDGRYLAQVLRQGAKQSLWVRQVATGSQVEIVPVGDQAIGNVCFSPDGEYLYFLRRDPDAQLYRVLFQVPSLGGTPRKILFDIDTAVTFSPDGRQIAFVRGYPHLGETALLVAPADGSSEKKLVVAKQPESIEILAPSWSPDGSRIAMMMTRGTVGDQVVVATVADGKRTPIGGDRLIQATSLAWLPTGDGLIVTGGERGGSLNSQVWEVGYPGGELRRITNDLNGYTGVSVAADSRRIVTVRTDQISNLWVAPASDPGAAKQITFGSSGDEAIGSFDVAADGSIVFHAVADNRLHLHSIASDGGGRKAITSGSSYCLDPHVAAAARVVVFTSVRENESSPHVWRADLDGGNLTQVTDGPGEVGFGVDPQGRWAYYGQTGSRQVLWRIPLAGGTPAQVGTPFDNFIGVSPDGTRIAYGYTRQEGDRVRGVIVITPAEGGQPLATLPAPETANDFTWAPSGDALDYVNGADEHGDLWRLPFDGSQAHRIAHFANLLTFRSQWSPDGKQVVLTRGERSQDVVLITDFR